MACDLQSFLKSRFSGQKSNDASQAIRTGPAMDSGPFLALGNKSQKNGVREIRTGDFSDLIFLTFAL
jgi:hypothetical protein